MPLSALLNGKVRHAGVGTSLKVLPSQCTARDWQPLTSQREPTIQMSLAETAAMSLYEPGLSSSNTLHWVPSQCSIKAVLDEL